MPGLSRVFQLTHLLIFNDNTKAISRIIPGKIAIITKFPEFSRTSFYWKLA